MSFGREDIDSIIRHFYSSPNQQDYLQIKSWYDLRSQSESSDFITYVYMFLLGANMKHRYEDYDKEQHNDYIIKVRDLTQGSNPESLIRKAYFNFGFGN